MHADRTTILIAALGLLPAVALAHPGHDTPGFVAGLMHPVAGIDHLLAMVAVGWWSAAVQSRRWWLVPAAFASSMLAGALLGLAGFQAPATEALVALSPLVIGGLMLMRRTLSLASASVLAGSLALFHGHAHGSELPASGDTAAWLLGMIAATLLLHLAGAALALASRRDPRALRVAGALVTVAGAGLLIGL